MEMLVDEPGLAQSPPRRAARRGRSRTAGAISSLYFVRRYSAKLLYEIEFFQADGCRDDAAALRRAAHRRAEDPREPGELPRRQRRLATTSRATFARGRSRRSFANSCGREFGNDWFARREAGDLLRELWSLGQGPTADELLYEVTGAKLEMASVGERIREGLAA